MKSFGTILKEAREAKGLTCSQIAHDTHMLVQIVEDMEREDFRRIPAPIYGRGFVRLYAERVGLDPAPLISAFMDIYEGRTAPRAEVCVPPPAVPEEPEPLQAPGEETPPAPDDAPAAESEVPPAVRGLDLFDAPSPCRPFQTPGQDKPAWESPYASAYAPAPSVSDGPSAAQRFQQGLSNVSHGVLGTVRSMPKATWRIALLAGMAIMVLVLVVWGCRALYRATETGMGNGPLAAATPPPAEEKAGPAPAKPLALPSSKSLKSTGPKMPELYID